MIKALLLALLLATGCGYHPAGVGEPIPVSIYAQNDTVPNTVLYVRVNDVMFRLGPGQRSGCYKFWSMAGDTIPVLFVLNAGGTDERMLSLDWIIESGSQDAKAWVGIAPQQWMATLTFYPKPC